MLNIEDIIEATDGKVVAMGERLFSGVSIDSRTIRHGELFVALKGDRFDGHDFIAAALAAGSGALINAHCTIHSTQSGGKTIIAVDDTLHALQDLARYIRKRFKGPVIGIIGSNGKTTTKELVASILNTRLKVLKTPGNLNNHIGMPLSITRADADTRAMVLEMGTNRPGDIDELCRIALPDTAVVTNIGLEHLEGFGSLDKVRESELEITPYVERLVLNADDSFLMEGVTSRSRKGFDGELITFGIENPAADLAAADIALSDGGTRFSLETGADRITVNSKLAGRFNVYNSLAAAAAAHALGFSLQEIKTGLESCAGVSMRFEIRKEEGVTFLNDSYNANPSSMEESIKELVRRIEAPGHNGHKQRRAIAVLGDMLELGSYSADAHKKLGQWMSGLPVEVFIGVGPLMGLAVSEFGGRGIHAGTSEDAGTELKRIMREGDIVLIKGSRGMRMERVLSVAGGEPARSGGAHGVHEG